MVDPHTLSIAIAAGGTAGHINPALALAEELRQRGADVTFFGQPTKLEGELVPAAGFSLVPLKMCGFDRARPWTGIKALLEAYRAKKEIEVYYKTHKRPQAVVGFGAYVETPLVAWAAEHDVPVVLHEQNSVPGLANKMNAQAATTIAYAFDQAKDELQKRAKHTTRFVKTGNPLRKEVLDHIQDAQAQHKKEQKKARGSLRLLVFGGSLGAVSLNEAMVFLKESLLSISDLEIVQATGKKNFEKATALLHLSEQEKKRWKVLAYLDDMGTALGSSDVVLSRAGASTVAEIAAAGVPSVLVPYPHARGNHQAFNARLLADAGAALIVRDDMLLSQSFKEEMLGVLTNKKKREQMKKAAQKLQKQQATDELFEAVLAACATRM